jgi:Family of unknown function (DUF5690)
MNGNLLTSTKMELSLGVRKNSITKWLENANGFWFSLYAAGSAFCLYTCVYAFRKTFPVATFEGLTFGGMHYKDWLVISQILGYGLSKFIGIKVISELQARSRSAGILLMVAIAGISWLFFAIVPPPYNIIFLFTNGLPLGMIWGMVFGYLEGRRFTEVLGAGLSVSFIFSAGLCKSVGGWLIKDWGASEYWMPFVASCLFLPPLLTFLWLLNQLPPPSALDEQLRTRRQPMEAHERKNFTLTFLPGIILFVLAYMMLTIFRDLRDNYGAEIWKILGYGNSPEIFTTTEIPVSIVVLVIMGSLMFIKGNHRALMVNHIIIISGMVIIGLATWLFETHIISPVIWMTAVGLGLYLGYVPFNSIFFDRLIAAFQYVGTVGFIMYVSDSFGYLGSMGVVIYKALSFGKVSWLNFFISFGYIISVAGTLLISGSMFYFNWKHQKGVSKNNMIKP